MSKKKTQSIETSEVFIPELEVVGFSKAYSDVLKKADDAKSKQIEDNGFVSMSDDIVDPMNDINSLFYVNELNTRNSRLMKSKARNNAGLGFTIIPKFTDEQIQSKIDRSRIKNTLEEEKKLIEEEKDTLADFLENCNPDLPFSTLLDRMELERQICGNGYLEIVRDINGIPAGIFHVPAISVRIRRRSKGFVQIKDGKKVYFKKFGDTRIMDSQTGLYTDNDNELNKTEKANKENTPFTLVDILLEDGTTKKQAILEPERQASEILHHIIYSPTDPFYGVPDWISAMPSMLGNRYSQLRNLAFFENDGLPRCIITITGGRIGDETKTELTKFLSSNLKGTGNAHRSIVLQLTKNYGGNDKPELKVEPLTIGKSEDQTFGEYRTANDEEIREANGYPKLFLGTSDDVNRASAIVVRQVTNQQEIEPSQREIEFMLNKKLVNQGLNLTRVLLKLNKPKVNDDLDDSMIIKNLTQSGIILPNEGRKRAGLEDSKDEWTKKPTVFTLAENKTKSAVTESNLPSDTGNNAAFEDQVTGTDISNNKMGIKPN